MAQQGIKIHEGNAANRDSMLMTIPLFLMATFFYGPRVLLLALVAMVTARLTDRLAAMLRGRRYNRTENSSVAVALIIVLLMPATVYIRVVVAAVVAAVLVGKEAFGGYNSYPFNPAAVGFCIAAVSWPQQVHRYPPPSGWLFLESPTLEQYWNLWTFKEVQLVEGPSLTLRNGALPKIDFWNLLLGNYAGPIGVTCALVILSCAVYLVVKRRVPVLPPVLFLGTIALIAFFFPRFTEISWATWPQDIMLRLQVVKFEGLCGAQVFAAVFMVSEPGTLPKKPLSQAIYGVLLGVATMLFRYFGTYELGICFAFLLVNVLSGYIDHVVGGFAVKPRGREAVQP